VGLVVGASVGLVVGAAVGAGLPLDVSGELAGFGAALEGDDVTNALEGTAVVPPFWSSPGLVAPEDELLPPESPITPVPKRAAKEAPAMLARMKTTAMV
jgi:hypothetical protein